MIYVQQRAYVPSLITPTASAPIMHQPAVGAKAGVGKKDQVFLLKNARDSTTSSSECAALSRRTGVKRRGEPCVRWKGRGARVYLEIVGLGASFHGRQRVYGRLGHFDLHHLPRARGGGMRTDMGSCGRRRAPNLKTGQSAAGKRPRDRTHDGRRLLMPPAERERGSLVRVQRRGSNEAFGMEASPWSQRSGPY